jgi:hypothetical protein
MSKRVLRSVVMVAGISLAILGSAQPAGAAIETRNTL